MIATARQEKDWERNGQRPTLLVGACRSWPTAAYGFEDWRRLLANRRARLESPGRVGGIVDWDTARSTPTSRFRGRCASEPTSALPAGCLVLFPRSTF